MILLTLVITIIEWSVPIGKALEPKGNGGSINIFNINYIAVKNIKMRVLK